MLEIWDGGTAASYVFIFFYFFRKKDKKDSLKLLPIKFLRSMSCIFLKDNKNFIQLMH